MLLSGHMFSLATGLTVVVDVWDISDAILRDFKGSKSYRLQYIMAISYQIYICIVYIYKCVCGGGFLSFSAQDFQDDTKWLSD